MRIRHSGFPRVFCCSWTIKVTNLFFFFSTSPDHHLHHHSSNQSSPPYLSIQPSLLSRVHASETESGVYNRGVISQGN